MAPLSTLDEEQEKMRANIDALYATLGKSALPSPPTDVPFFSASAAAAPPTPSAAAASFLPKRTAATLSVLPTGASPESPFPSAQLPRQQPDAATIELTGELQEVRTALDAEHSLSQKLNRQLADVNAKMASIAHERSLDRAEARRATEAQKAAEANYAAAATARDDAMRRLAAVQQTLANTRQQSDYAVAEARAQNTGAVEAAEREKRSAEARAEDAAARARVSDEEGRQLRAEASALRDELQKVREALREALLDKEAAQQDLAAAKQRDHQGSQHEDDGAGVGIAWGGGRSRHDADAGAAAGPRNAHADEVQRLRAEVTAAKRGMAEAQHRNDLQAERLAVAEAEATRLRKARGALVPAAPSSSRGSPGATTPYTTAYTTAHTTAYTAPYTTPSAPLGSSAAAASAVVRVAELEAKVFEVEAELSREREKTSRRSSIHQSGDLSVPATPAPRPPGVDLVESMERVALAERRTRQAQEAAAAEAVKTGELRRQVEDLRGQMEARGTTARTAQEDVGAAKEEAALAVEARDEAEHRLRELMSRVSVLQGEREAWTVEARGDKERLRELEYDASNHAKEVSRLHAELDDLRANAQRRAEEALAVREMGRDAAVAQITRPSMDLLRENEKLRREVEDLRKEGMRRASEAVVAMHAYHREQSDRVQQVPNYRF